ncbi:MAG: hypothetical protein ACI9SK_001901 [Zhongshania sp.]|jgi:hypothetical protein
MAVLVELGILSEPISIQACDAAMPVADNNTAQDAILIVELPCE